MTTETAPQNANAVDAETVSNIERLVRSFETRWSEYDIEARRPVSDGVDDKYYNARNHLGHLVELSREKRRTFPKAALYASRQPSDLREPPDFDSVNAEFRDEYLACYSDQRHLIDAATRLREQLIRLKV